MFVYPYVSAVSAVCVCVSVVRCELVCVCACVWRVLHLPSPPPRGCLAWTTTFPGYYSLTKNLQLSHLPVPSLIDHHPWASHGIPPPAPLLKRRLLSSNILHFTPLYYDNVASFFSGNQRVCFNNQG